MHVPGAFSRQGRGREAEPYLAERDGLGEEARAVCGVLREWRDVAHAPVFSYEVCEDVGRYSG